MHRITRYCAAPVILALVLGLGAALPFTSASAAAPAAERTSACEVVSKTLANAVKTRKKRLKAMKKTRKKFRALKKRTPRTVKVIKKTRVVKKRLAKRKVRLKGARKAVRSARLQQARVCVASTPTAPVDRGLTPAQLQVILDLISEHGGGLTIEQLEMILNSLAPGASFTPEELEAILSALQEANLDALAALLAQFGDQLTPEQFQQLLALIAAMGGDQSVEGVIGLLLGLSETLTDTLEGIGLGAVSDLVQLLLTGLGQSGEIADLDLADLTSLLDQLLPGVTDLLDASLLQDLLGSITGGGGLDAGVLSDLLGGVLSLDQILGLLDGVGDEDALTGLLGGLLPQLNALVGGVLEVPDALGLGALLDGVVALLDGLLGGLVCTILPVLCD